ncbi:hypothetical protein P2318_09270 [Myxococcaceae bacterium GXIMD 01537]
MRKLGIAGRRSARRGLWGGVALLLASGAWALPRPGQTLPPFAAKDLEGGEHESSEIRGHRTLVIAITDSEAGDAMQRWFDAADAKLGRGAYPSTALISLKLPFFVSTGAARGRAKERVPQQFWDDTWLDKNGGMARVLGLPESNEPFALVVDAQGRVVASAHGPPSGADAGAIWAAMAGHAR